MGTEKVTASTLPPEVLIHVFEYLDISSKGNAAQVCTSWRKAADYKSTWKHITIKFRSGNLNVQSEQSIIKRGVKRFDVCIFDRRFNEFLRRVPELEELRFIGCCIKQNVRNFFDTLPDSNAVMGFAVEYNEQIAVVMNDHLECINSASIRYHEVNSSRCQPSNDSVLKTFTRGMKQLKVLYLDGCPSSDVETDHFVGEDMVNEDQLPSLQELCYRNCRKAGVKEETMDYICRKFGNLVSLNFEGCQIHSNKGFVHLPKLEKLECLSFMSSRGITDAPLNSISHLSNLKSLDLGRCEEITDRGLEFISRLKNLTFLTLNRLRGVTDPAFRNLSKLPRLSELSLHFSTISDMGLLYLTSGNLKLTKLNLYHCQNVEDQGLLHICQSTFILHELDISGCGVTDYGVSLLIDKFPHMQGLYLIFCPRVTSEMKKLIVEKFHQKKHLCSNSTRQDHDFMALSANQLDSYLESYINNFGL